MRRLDVGADAEGSWRVAGFAVLVRDTQRSMLLRYISHRLCPKATLLAELHCRCFCNFFSLWQLNPALVPDSFWNDVRENIFFKNSTPLNRLPGKEGNPVRKPIEEFLGAVTLAPLSRDRIRSTANMGWKH